MLLPETLALHDQEKYEFHYVYFLPWKNQLVSAIEENGGKITCLNAKNNIKILASYGKIIRYIKQHDIQLLHCHLPWAGFVGRLVHKLTGIPVLYTEHNKQERYHKITFIINKFTFNWQNKVLGVSDDVCSSIQKNINPKIEVATLLNGVNTEKFQRQREDKTIREELKIPDEGIVVGTVAVFRFQKRLVEWLQVMKEVTDKDSRYYGIVVGDGPLKEEIHAEHKRLGLEGKVFFAGLQSVVKPWFNAFDMYMMVSVFEGLPIALLEAMSMECAVVTTDAGGIKEVITNRSLGRMVGVDNYAELSTELLALNSAAERQQLATNGRNHIVKNFSMELMVNELERVYNQTLKSSV